ncbi:MAG: hypothetical protein IME93_01150 [Proteobacteria bacterium]|nr:hypothetical protein [Pseudomonadota bacterium]
MDRVKIGDNFTHQTLWKIFVGVPLIYVPIIFTVPFVAVCVFLVKAHLRLMGAQNIRSYRDFVPQWVSHRYRYGDQITYSSGAKWHNLRAYRWYWIFNCKLYCPLSVALFRYMAYLVKIVENWWCPFEHDQKGEYAEGAIDKSYWHLHQQEKARLHPDDRVNPVWNEDAEVKIDRETK